MVASKRETGFKLFTEWESALRTGKNSPAPSLNQAQQREARYTLLFYAGRIRRQQGKHEEAADLFTRALALTSDPVQEDACIWYILSSTFTGKPENTAALIKTYAGRWHQDDDFYDILDRLSCYLTAEKKWNDLVDVFARIRNGKDGASIAKYAYLVGRAVSLGYVSGKDMSAADYYTVAYEEGNASFYYRALAASYLGKTISPVRNQGTGKSLDYPHEAELEFYVKFFEYGGGVYAMPYLRENADRYTKYELRILAGTFAGAGRYLESIQIVGLYMRRDDYEMETADLELYYPKPFTQLIEKYALANGLHPQVFFGLIRTESAFIPDIASHAGAVGLAQLMPATAREVAAVIKKRGGPDYTGGEIDLTNPEINVQMGAVYLKDLTDSLGSSMLALLAYNGGPGRISRLRRAAPSMPEDLFIETITIAETRNYGKRVMAAAAAYGYLYYGMSMHEVVADIFK
jgi:soluble lytic murein transglycosylase